MKKAFFPLLSIVFIIICASLVYFERESSPTYVKVVSDVETARPTIAEASEPPEVVEVILVNINTAGLDELVLLPGIGEVIGRRIIDYRESGGPFAAKEELMEVSGIGESVFEGLKDLIVI